MWSSGRETNLLFYKYNMYGVIEAQKKAVVKAVDDLPEKRIKEEDMGALASEVAAKLSIDVPVLDEQNITVSKPSDVQVEVHDRFGFPDDGSRRVRGTSVTLTVPYTGDEVMFYVRPTTSDSDPPRADVGNGELRLTITGVQLQQDQLRNEFNGFLESVKKYLGWQRENVASFNHDLPQFVVQALVERKKRLIQADDLVSSLGFKVR